MNMTIDPHNYLYGFTSDLHLYHSSVISLNNRPYKDIWEMNEDIRDRHNRIFDKDSIIFNLGDVILRKKHQNIDEIQILNFLKTFKGRIYTMPGNHRNDLHIISRAWKCIPEYQELKVKDSGVLICLFHYPIRAWNKAHHGSWHLHGHTHGALRNDNMESFEEKQCGRALDVGIDNNNYNPFIFSDVQKIMEKRKYNPELYKRIKRVNK